jgi:hypothetical protein
VYEAHPDTSLLVSIEKDNHYTKEETYSIPAEDTEIELPVLFRKSRWDLSLFYTVNYPLGIGAGYRYHIISEYIYLYALGGLYYHPASYRPVAGPGAGYFILNLEAAPGIGFCPFIPVRSPVRLLVGIDFLMDLYYLNNPERKSFVFTGMFDLRLRLDINFPQWMVFLEMNGMGGIPIISSSGTVYSTNRMNWSIGVTWKR